jgi:predicted flap endonuclease-1-like 5' DNA nuclease
MSLQRGADIRGWEGVTRNMAIDDHEGSAARFTVFGIFLALIVTGISANALGETDIPTIAKALLGILLFLFLLMLIFAAQSVLRRKGSEARSALNAKAAGSTGEDAGAAARRADDAARQRAAADAARRAEAAEAARAKEAAAAAGPDRDGDGVFEGKNEGTRPEALTAARGGKADDLKLIKGVGPKLEKLCNSLGFYHFDQIANWTSDEVAWVDSNLEGFSGRVTRDEWVAQAKILASGGETEFSSRQ